MLDFILQVMMYLAVVIGVLVGIAMAREQQKQPPRPKAKRYVMRGYGGGKNATSLHPRQAKRGKRIVYIPGVGYRHVQAGKRKRG